MPGESVSSPRRITAREKQRQALELRKAGATFEVIAKQLGYAGRQGAEKAVAAALRRITKKPAQELKKLDIERLDSYLLALSKRIRSGDAFAINTALAVLARRAKLLGLDMPIEHKIDGKIEVESPDLTAKGKAELEAALTEVERLLGIQ